MSHRALGVAIAVLAIAAGCGDDGDAAGEASYADIAALDAALEEAGHECALEYEGLVDEAGTETSQCTIERQPAILRVYDDTAVLTAFVDPDRADAPVAVAFGADWSVEVLEPATAASLADALGGSTP